MYRETVQRSASGSSQGYLGYCDNRWGAGIRGRRGHGLRRGLLHGGNVEGQQGVAVPYIKYAIGQARMGPVGTLARLNVYRSMFDVGGRIGLQQGKFALLSVAIESVVGVKEGAPPHPALFPLQGASSKSFPPSRCPLVT